MIVVENQKICSDTTVHYARAAIGAGWVLSWLPGRIVAESQAMSGVLLAELVAAKRVLHPQDLAWIGVWAAALHVDVDAAVAAVRRAPACQPDPRSRSRGRAGGRRHRPNTGASA